MRLFFIIFLLFHAYSAATPRTLKFVLYFPQVPPYMYTNDHRAQVHGIVPESLAEFFEKQQIDVRYVIDNRKGAEHRLYSGDVDAMLLAANWAEQPQRLIFSVPLLTHRDYLYSMKPFAAGSDLRQWLPQRAVCTRQYYVYEALQPFFDADTKRIDSSSELAQMRMLLNGRCEYVYMNEHVASWLQFNQFPTMKFYQSPQSFGNVGLTIAFHPKWQALLPELNRYLLEQQRSGRFEKILQQELKKKGQFSPAFETN